MNIGALAFAYILLLPFVRFTVPVGPFGLTMSDAAGLAMMGGIALRKGGVAQLFGLPARFRLWLACLGVFVVMVVLSAVRVGGWRAAFEAFAFGYAWLISLSMAIVVSSGEAAATQRLRRAYRWALAAAVAPVVVWLLVPDSDRWLAPLFNSVGKYEFLFVTPNQFACFVLVGLMLTLACGPLILPFDLLLFMASGLGILSSASRAGTAGYLVLAAAYLVLPAESAGGLPLARGTAWLSRVVLVAFLALLAVSPRMKSTYAARSLSVVEFAQRGKVADPFREAQFKRAVAEIRSHPFSGIGAGRFAQFSLDGYELHNSLLSIFVETGVGGFIAFVALQAVLVASVLRSKRPRARKIGGLAALGACFLFMLAHYVIRERWLWVLYLLMTAYFEEA